MVARNLYELLEHAALDPQDNKISVYNPGNVDQVGKSLTYADLLNTAKTNALLLPQVKGIRPDSVILLHFDNHFDAIVWFWSVIAAGYVPAISTPFTNDPEGRKKHLIHLKTLLKDPVIITQESLAKAFSIVDGLNTHTIESIQKFDAPHILNGVHATAKQHDDLAVLMLTSGSSGNAKAVCLRHGQLLQSIAGKSTHHGISKSDVFLNWIGLDHVANLTETHLQAMQHAAPQFHVQASDLLVDPLILLKLIDRHRITVTFAPNFFIASVRVALEHPEPFLHGKEPDLTCFRIMISGGEANVVEASQALTTLFQKYGVSSEFIRPGFGMTETCAGSIYSRECPSYDVSNKWEFASLGTCIPGLQMRISSDSGEILSMNQVGNLELFGPILFHEYYNNPVATAEAFTADHWFRTGDHASIDGNGRLSLAGRAKETIIVNGVKYFPHELETAIEDALIPGLTPSYTVVFPHRPKNSQTEAVCVVYLPSYEPEDVLARVGVADAISKISIMQTGVKPFQIIPLDKTLLPKSSLGKLSRAKTRAAFEAGKYEVFQKLNDDAIHAYRATQNQAPSNETEATILHVFADLFEIPEADIGVNTSLFEMGVSSIEIIKFKQRIQTELKLKVEIPVITMLTNPTIRGLAGTLETLMGPQVYSPKVTLQAEGKKTPLWLVHPGVGEVLVFLNLAKFIVDRPIHALRARGFDGEPFFEDIAEVVSTYHQAIKEEQPEGPYAIAGYSYGSMLAFEVSKVLEANGDKVEFLGVFNLPPHIKFRMRQLDWVEVLLNLSYFLDLMTEEEAHRISPEMHELSNSLGNDKVLDYILERAPRERMHEMALDRKKMSTWADLAYRMQAIAQDYDPSGRVRNMDIFYAIPLVAVAKSKKEWVDNHLVKWRGFVDEEPHWHEVDGAHYTMLGPDNIHTFQKTLRASLEERGL
uniref:Nonribosomal peptide synthetase acyN n=1 Tax=Ascocoryne sarcoides TaxID=139061 RepID=ACYN_ASCSA|nr:RecName: Full=Nonribosomal peptide synthetase acyN; AltName: Full=Polyporic acid synthetase acyN [Ascocoryne sarcoides]UQS21311.1 AcyN [synthetic construct]